MNLHSATVADFGREWRAFDQSKVDEDEARRIFDGYFSQFDFNSLGEGFDLGCGSGRWARLVAPKARLLHCIDPSDAIEVARDNLAGQTNVTFHKACAQSLPLKDGSQDFGYCLGVLHHVPDPQTALNNAVRKLRPGGQFLLYVYYALDNRPWLYRALWRVSDVIRQGVCRLPFSLKKATTTTIAAVVYWPLARFGRGSVLASYRDRSFYAMRTDALDRFGTRLERRFTKDQVREMMTLAGLDGIRFNEHMPHWTAIGFRSPA